MATFIEKADNKTLPMIFTHNIVAFPSVSLSFELDDEKAIAAAEAATGSDSFVFMIMLREPEDDNEDERPEPQYYETGTVVKIRQSVKTPDNKLRVVAEGYARAKMLRYYPTGNYLTADVICRTIHLTDSDSIDALAYKHVILRSVADLLRTIPNSNNDLLTAARAIKAPALLADFIASNILFRAVDKQEVLEQFEPVARLETLLTILQEEQEILETESSIQKRVRANMNRNQRDYFLREQLRVIQEELGDRSSDAGSYTQRINELNIKQPAVKEKLLKEADKLAKLPFGSAEASVISAYLDVCLELPWTKKTKDRIDVEAASKILEADHDGLEKVKERILEYLAVRQLNPDLKSTILCLVGPPGVGKTSIAASIARSMKRKYVRVSLGGVRDEADIRGHRKTYIGAMPGRIMTALSQVGVCNPLILLDEIDKLTQDAHGNPASALLEVLDSEQNKTFRDHFVELPFDLSDCVFIATANTLQTVPKPLIDRMEIIEIDSYTKTEKTAIAKHHLIKKQLKRHGLSKTQLHITDGALSELIDYYTHEAGVRNLERAIADLCRKTAAKILAGENAVVIKADDVKSYLGPRKYMPDKADEADTVGQVNGLAYTEYGGSLLKVEVAVMDGTGRVQTTGSLGKVMEESASIAVSYVRTIASKYHIPADFYQKKDIHIHFPEGAVPKDGPSAGVTMVTALVSALSGTPVRQDIAMTGEISLLGKVLPIGGLKEKTMAAYTAGIRQVVIPAENLPDLEEIDPKAREALSFLPCSRIEEVLSHALRPVPEPIVSEHESQKALPEIRIPDLQNDSVIHTI